MPVWRSQKAKFRVSTPYRAIKRHYPLHISIKITGWVQRRCNNDLSFCKVKSHGNDGYLCALGDVIETCSQFLNLLPRALWRHRQNKFIVPIENADYLLHHVLTCSSFNGVPSQRPEEPAKWWLDQLTLAKELGLMDSQDASCCNADNKVPIAGVRSHCDHEFLDVDWHRPFHLPAKQLEKQQNERAHDLFYRTD